MKTHPRLSWLGPGLVREWIGVTLVACGLTALLLCTGATAGADRLVYDRLMQARQEAPSDRILLVAIDDESLRTVGAWPWSRATHARLLDRLAGARPAAIGYDVMFLEPQPDDRALAEALRRSGRTVLPVAALSPGDDGRAVRILRPVGDLAPAAAKLGDVELASDPDGVVRRASAAVAAGGRCWLALGVTLLDVASPSPRAQGAPCGAMATDSGRHDGLVVSPPRLIPFAGPPGAFRTISASAVIAGEVPQAFIRDKLVLIGAVALGLGDRHGTAISAGRGAMAGVEVQANLLDAALRDRAITELGPLALLVFCVAPVLGLCLLLPRLSAAAGLAAGTASIGVVLAGGLLAFSQSAWVPPLSTVAGLAAVYPLWSWRRLAAASRTLAKEIERLPQPAGLPATARIHDVFGRQLDSLSRAASLLRDLSRRMELTLQSLPDPTVVAGSDGVIVFANNHARGLGDGACPDPAGVAVEAWLGRAFDRQEATAALQDLESGAASVFLRSRGGVDYVAAQAGLVTEGGALEGVILRLHDISSERQAARQREEVIQLLTHDLRAPLASILALLAPERLLARQDGDRIGAYARRALALAEGYVQFARAETKALKREPLDLSELVIEAVDELWPQASAKGVRVETTPSTEPAWIDGDRSLVARALVNLLDNAIKVSTAGRAVTTRVRRTHHVARCIIEDEGPGLPPGDAASLFAPFQMGPANGTTQPGVGLGLAIVQMVMQRHGGRASCEALPVGARFVLEFPLLAEESDATAEDGRQDRASAT